MAPTPAATPSVEPNEHFEKGMALKKRTCYFGASAEFQMAAETGLANADLFLEWGWALSGTGAHAKAIEKYQKASELEPARADIYVFWAGALRNQGNFVESAEKYTRAISLDPQNLGAYWGLKDALEKQTKWKEAIEVCRKIVESDPNASVYRALVNALDRLLPEDRTTAVREWERQLNSNPRFASALRYWGDALAEREKYEEAIDKYRQSSALDPSASETYLNWGQALWQRQAYAEGLLIYLKTIEHEPVDTTYIGTVADALAGLSEEPVVAAQTTVNQRVSNGATRAALYCRWGDGLAGQERYTEAIARYRDALQADPTLYAAYLGWGEALAEQREYDDAIEQYGQAARLEPASAQAYRKWANALRLQERYTEAAEQYKQVIERDLDEVDYDEFLDLADKLDSKRKQQALETLESAVARSADAAGHYISWGYSLSNREKYPEAIAQYEKAIRLDEKKPGAWQGLANAQDAAGDYASAIQSYRKITELDSYDGSAYLRWGNVCFAQKKFSDAVEIYRRGAPFMPNPEWAFLNCGKALAEQRQYAQAAASYQQALVIQTNFSEAHDAWGWALYLQQNYDDAIAQFEKAVEKGPTNANAHMNWGLVLAVQQMYDAAMEHYQIAVELNPSEGYTYLNWANVLAEQGAYAEAIAKCEQATQIIPDFAYGYHNIAWYYWAQGDYAGARIACEKACQVYERAKQKREYQRDPDFFRYYGSVLQEYLWRPEEAEQIFREGLAANPEHTGILGSLASLYLDRQDRLADGAADGAAPTAHGKARECFKKAERLLKKQLERYEDSSTLQELGSLYLKMGEYDDAKNYLEKALAKNPDSTETRVSLGVLYSRKEDFREAARHFEAVRRRDQSDLNAWSNLGEIYLKLNPKDVKQIEKAEAVFQKILRVAPQHIDSQIGLGEVYTAKAEAGEKEWYEAAITQYGNALQLAERRQGSKNFKSTELAALHYSRGYARVRRYEASRPFSDEALLREAFQDFRRCAALDPDHCKAKVAMEKLDVRLNRATRRWIPERVAPWLVLGPALFVLIFTQLTFFFGTPRLQKPIDSAGYIALTFGALVFVVVGLFLPEIQKLKGAGIELEKSTVTQISTSASLGISKD